MAIQKVKYFGSSVLERPAKEVKNMTPEIRTLIRDMLDTMHHYHGVGLAAPQIGISRRVIVIDCGRDYQDEPLVLINPEIVAAEGRQTGEEGCLSFPGVFLPVTRPMKVTARFRSPSWRVMEVEAEGLLARAIAHELDHLEGKLFIDLVEDQELREREMAKLQERLARIISGRDSASTLAGQATAF